ncbi:hypothetical protein QEZ47_01900 [Aminobacter anthyllidis]|uniref:hypothetical protein n=1 Tax=Aminobacter anthyllidis TaxID=1035067 RepID=UPI002457643A|nr:hypothetical protein [Aminobacter anthyllidis]MDH4984337.1 hypothetical protein [Aminobacter anthyllidis]
MQSRSDQRHGHPFDERRELSVQPTVYHLRSINWPLPDDPAATHATAFLIGVCAMWISDIAFDVIIRRIKGEPPA